VVEMCASTASGVEHWAGESHMAQASWSRGALAGYAPAARNRWESSFRVEVGRSVRGMFRSEMMGRLSMGAA
jgi:hypothetical protein